MVEWINLPTMYQINLLLLLLFCSAPCFSFYIVSFQFKGITSWLFGPVFSLSLLQFWFHPLWDTVNVYQLSNFHAHIHLKVFSHPLWETAPDQVSYSLEAYFDLHSFTLQHENKTWQEMGSATNLITAQLQNVALLVLTRLKYRENCEIFLFKNSD